MAPGAQTPTELPRHVAIIMDGNGRWARKRYLPREAGHVAGVSAVREVVRAATDIKLEYLTLFAFSSENWKRPKPEVNALMGLFRGYFRSDLDELHGRGVRVRIASVRSLDTDHRAVGVLSPRRSEYRIPRSSCGTGRGRLACRARGAR